MGKLYSISINWNNQPQDTTKLEAAIESASMEWVRLSGAQYYVWTAKTRKEVRTTISHLFEAGSYFIVVSIEPLEAHGRAPQWLWDWLNGKMSQQLQDQFKNG